MSEPTIQELIQEIDLCLELLGYEREALERMEEDGYEEHLRYGVFPGNLEDVKDGVYN